MGERTSEIKKGPSRLGANLQFSYRHFRLRASSHTLSPFWKGENFDVDRSLIILWAMSCAARALFLASDSSLMWLSAAGIWVSEITEGSGLGS